MFLSPSRRRWLFLIIPAIVFFLSAPSPNAQRRTLDNVPEGPVRFSVDSVPFYDPATEASFLVIFYKVVNDHLQFIKEDGGYRADFQVVSVVYDREGHQVTGDEISGTQRAETYDLTNSLDTYVQGHFQFPLPPGSYELKVWIEGQHSGKMVRTQMKSSMPDFRPSSLTASGLLLAHQIWPLGTPGEGYERNGLLMVPSVDHSYGDLFPKLFCYFEIYDLLATESVPSRYEAVFEIINSSDRVVLCDTSAVTRRGLTSYAFRDFQVASLEEDQYVLRLTVSDPGGNRMVQRETTFQMRWSTLGQIAKDYDEAVEQLRYIATDEEYKKLKAAQGDDRRDIWLEFWEQRDPTPGTPVNEMKIEYYRRIEYANVHFSVVSPGWRTDRGRIYIIYGPPDDIEHHPMEIETKPYQIWHYYNTNRLFYFVDEDGYGDYKLVAWR